MKVETTKLEGVKIITPDVFGDDRGLFYEQYNKKKFSEIGIDKEFVQQNLSKSKQGTLRGLHFQTNPWQAKLVNVILGKVFDVFVDLREGSPTFGQWDSIELSAENKKMVYIPEGFAHGFCVLSDEAEFQYLCSGFYNKESESGIIWNDPDIGINWPITDPVLSEKDQHHKSFKEVASKLKSKKKVLVTGADGFLGTKIVNMLSNKYEIIPTGLTTGVKLDITNKDEVNAVVASQDPDIIVHTAAYTDVDGCETNKEIAYKVNVEGTRNLAETGKKLIAISTDFVFDGEKGNYIETDTENPLSYYGQTKYEAEQTAFKTNPNTLVLRTCVLYGYNGPNDKNTFPKWVINSLNEGKTIPVVTDQTVTPTLIDDIANAIDRLIEKGETGLYHVVGSEMTNRYEFAKRIKEVFNLGGEIEESSSENLNQTAKRPKNSSLNIAKLQSIGISTRNVTEGLKEMKRQMEKDGAI